MPHRRKPKIAGPPGLALPERPALEDASGWDKDRVDSLVEEMVAHEMESLKWKLDDTCSRLERIELLLFRASFSDFEKIDSFIAEILKQPDSPREPGGAEGGSPAARFAEECGGAPGAGGAPCWLLLDAPNAGPLGAGRAEDDPFEPFELLAGMALSPPEMLPGMVLSPRVTGGSRVLVHPSDPYDATAALAGTDKSLHARRLARQEYAEKLVARARVVCHAAAAIGQIGTLTDLIPAILVGSLIETTSFMDVLLRGSDGIRCRTAGPIIKVTNIQGHTVTFADASQLPAMDRHGRPIVGQTTMNDEVFCVVGHSRLGGVQRTYSEILAGS